jgi:dihydrodipicolinate synthase/N-acetylneuraminate lyase
MMKRSDELNESLGPLFSWLFKEPNPIGVNTMLMMLVYLQLWLVSLL